MTHSKAACPVYTGPVEVAGRTSFGTRRGGPDGGLVFHGFLGLLLDQAPGYDAEHLLNPFSVFRADLMTAVPPFNLTPEATVPFAVGALKSSCNACRRWRS